MERGLLATLGLLLALSSSATSIASDGAFEINQACAVNTGCFSGDNPGFPVSISAPGRYQLTSNLVLPDPGARAIRIDSSSTTIDLNGFEIAPSGCEGSKQECNPGASPFGWAAIWVASANGVTVRNGSIAGMSQAISLGRNSRVHGVHAQYNYEGIHVGENSVVENSRVFFSQQHGIHAGQNSVVRRCITRGNGFGGISVNSGSIVESSVTAENGSFGVIAAGSLVRGNNITNNGTSGSGYGILATGYTGYLQNVITVSDPTPTRGAVSGGTDLGSNLCNGTTGCP